MDKVKAIKVLKPLVDSYVDYANISMKEEDDNIVEALEMAVEALKELDVPDTNVGNKISKFIDGIEEIFADIRERHGDDSVCGLCEYDGAYMGQSGDWCNECPGFDKDDCFKLSDETRKKWIEEIVNTYPDHTADISKKVSISYGHENDVISREAAIDAIHGRTFKEIVVRYPTYTTHPEHKGKPYFLIKYTENGQEFIGYGTCKPEVLSKYLKEDFMSSVQPNLQPTCNQLTTDTISRQVAIDALWKALYEYEDKTEKQFQESEDLDVGDWIEHRIFVQDMNDIDRQTILNLPSAQPEL